jgi:CRP-like cAMP-binding protein
VILADLEAGGFFGEMAPIDGHPRSASVLAVTDAVIATMPGAVFWKCFTIIPKYRCTCSSCWRHACASWTNRVLEYSTLDVRHRVSCELLRLARPDAKDSRRGVLAPVPTQAEIAARVSTTREAVVREMKLLEREGYLQRQRGALVLVDMPNLVQRLETED